MTLRLKDKELQKKLEELIPGFSESVCNGDFSATIYFTEKDVEESFDYREDCWNAWPAVTPPEREYMRVIVQTKANLLGGPDWRDEFIAVAYWDSEHNRWEYPSGNHVDVPGSARVLFRPFFEPQAGCEEING